MGVGDGQAEPSYPRLGYSGLLGGETLEKGRTAMIANDAFQLIAFPDPENSLV